MNTLYGYTGEKGIGQWQVHVVLSVEHQHCKRIFQGCWFELQSTVESFIFVGLKFRGFQISDKLVDI